MAQKLMHDHGSDPKLLVTLNNTCMPEQIALVPSATAMGALRAEVQTHRSSPPLLTPPAHLSSFVRLPLCYARERCTGGAHHHDILRAPIDVECLKLSTPHLLQLQMDSTPLLPTLSSVLAIISPLGSLLDPQIWMQQPEDRTNGRQASVKMLRIHTY
jgi:hypothetical protein